MYFNFHTHRHSNDSEIQSIRSLHKAEVNLIDSFPDSYFSIGIHPWFSENATAFFSQLEDLVLKENVITIGECGIDKIRGLKINEQIDIFKFQALLAERVRKPLVIHCVRAYNELINIKKELKPTVPWIIHGYRNNASIATLLYKEGFVLSFGFESVSNKLLVAEMPFFLNNYPFFLETDDLDPALIKDLYQEISIVLNIEIFTLQNIISSNYRKVFS